MLQALMIWLNDWQEDDVYTYNGDVIDCCVVIQQYPSAVDVISLNAHVQWSETVFRLGRHGGATFE